MVCGALASALVAALWLASVPAAHAAGRVALIVGIGAYTHAAPLPNSANDARAIGLVLSELGFEVVEAFDARKRAFDGALRAFADRSAGAEIALVYYAGHGLQVGGQNYLLPADARLVSERDLDTEAIRLDAILRLMQTGRAGRTSIVLLDACRDNPLAGRLALSMGLPSRRVERGLASVQSDAGMFIAFSTQPGNVARDGAGLNSPFSGALVRQMRASGKGLGAVMMEVRREVIAATGGKQVPWDHSALTREFYFRPAAEFVTSAPQPAPAEAVDAGAGWIAVVRR
jgi:uncharacterized caspase-like protein